MVALLIPEHQLGTAYGVMQAIQNLGLAVVVQTAGMLRDAVGFQWTELYFLMWMTCTLKESSGIPVCRSMKSDMNPLFRAHDLQCSIFSFQYRS